MAERRIIDLSGFLGPLAMAVGVPVVFLAAMLIGHVAIVNGWIQP